MDFELSGTQREVRDHARRFADERIVPFAADWDRERALPRALIRDLGREGFLGGPLEQAWGGRGWDNLSNVLALEEFGAADQSVRGFLSVHVGLVSQCLQDHGTREQKSRWLPALASGDAIGCYALTEEGAGSDVAAMECTAERDGEGWRLSGRKTWITNGNLADLCLVFARTDTQARHKGITAFLVPGEAEGLERSPVEGEMLGHRASDHARLGLDGVRVGGGDVLGGVGEGFTVAMSALDHGRLGVAAGGVGTARACLDAALEHCRERRQFGSRIGDFQMAQERLADIAAGVEAARLLVWKAAWLADRGEAVTRATSLAKAYATDVAQHAAETALLLLASRGYTDRSPVERHYRDIPGLRIYEGTNMIQKIVVARDLLGPDEEGKR